ncbi:glycosyltransferase family 2 protein [Agreia pratensis]|uniref:Glycosyltransferase, GT2 family n=1 Tax=Agreia pratensis TaxID=150121 RepID=A0A1X7JTZ4_9MICO|nr:galactosyltransferase-related protein [Agreia pratensis]MBF4635517.1 glycosyltransferase family 2 protein [Agreia pratensis]SMG31651.1 Glycosyltransferase, GT2 family [Agreia pratensis]
MTRVAVVTVVHGRHAHLALQMQAVARSIRRPDDYIVVAVDDEFVPEPVDSRGRVVQLPAHPLGLPIAAARNAGAEAALTGGADVLVFLDVDCVPGPELVGAYETAAVSPDLRDDILCGPVAYLPPAPPEGYDLESIATLAAPHSARPAPQPGEVIRGGDHDLFWSLSFAVTAATWRRLGGFDEAYVGYGGEDTDFAASAAEKGIELAWIGAARAYHQHHAVESPPVSHLDDIVRNAVLFHERWGRWPMIGWLTAFEEAGLITHSPIRGVYEKL